MKRQVVILTKAPVPGAVKTRLIPRLGGARATALHEWMVKATVDRALSLNVVVRVALHGALDSAFAAQLRAQGAVVEPQAGGDLGARMAAALRPEWDTALLGTDCPLFDAEALRASFDAPQGISVGPAADGGYWALRVRAAAGRPIGELSRALFDDMPWSTAQVFAETQRRCAQSKLDLNLLPVDYDVDEPSDLDRLVQDPRLDPPRRAQLLALLVAT
ncbi:MAG: TIGR04282 family arsenosugar biosynthesis glycosyltransferase [Deltaproteobacteria bacterium]|nr:TIGR04282 family arsenosugar biosynthesis glycosyltransferase [Deltaproteobacteria bacterium]